jgi:dipeptidyl aminopeptidase/acylaminoacyl peptidase
METIGLHMSVKVPSGLAWSPDGSRLAYQVSGPQGSQVWLYSNAGGQPAQLVDPRVPPFRLYKDLPQLHWMGDSRLVYYVGQSYRAWQPGYTAPELFCDTSLLGDLSSLSPDGANLSFIRDGDIWVAPLATGFAALPQQITYREGLLVDDSQLFSRLIQPPQWSPDGRWIAYLSPMANGWKVRVVSPLDGTQLNMAPAEDIWGYAILNWSPDSQKIVVSRLSNNFQRKELTILDLENAQERCLWADQDEKWVDHNIHPGFDVAWAGDSRRIVFLSNRSGWRHLYTADVTNGEVQQQTDGGYECFWAGWSLDGQQLAYVSSQNHLQQRQLFVTRLDGTPARILTPQPGNCLGGWYLRQANLAWSPDGSSIAHIYSGPDQMPVLQISRVSNPDQPAIVYDSRPEDLRQVMHLESLQCMGPDDRPVHCVLATAPDMDRQLRHPAVVFTYGAWDQEAQLGWDFGPKNLIFNYLVGQGYAVLLVDPRGSDGYGQAHAHGQYHEGGRKQVADVVAAAQFLAGLPFIDPHRLAMFGYSYGGYMVLQTLATAPQVFAAGVSMAPVSEWATYAGYSTYTLLRFGSPDEVPNPLFIGSPLYQAGRIQSPLLILHGTRDFNVPVASSEAMVGALLRAGKIFEYMTYPGEGHVWVQPATIRDSLLRMERFLNTYLKPQEEA